MRRISLALFILASGAAYFAGAQQPPSDVAPLKVVAPLPPGARSESSGIVRSRKTPDLFWTHGDSGNEPRIFPLHRDGSPYVSTAAPKTPGVLIDGARNVDWEDIAALDDGTLVIADLGNNGNARENLALYFVDEPAPTADRSAPARRIQVRYPDQAEFPPPQSNRNFDSEAVFAVGQTVFVLTKHRGNRQTRLYRLEKPLADQVNTLKFVAEYNIGGMVTAADCDPDGKRLLVLTYQKIWLFERDTLDTPFFEGRVSARAIFLPQAEAVCFADDKTLVLTDEIAATLFELPLSELRAQL